MKSLQKVQETSEQKKESVWNTSAIRGCGFFDRIFIDE